MKPDNFEDAYARIQAATKAKTQTEIASLLGIKQSSISDAKKKNTIPDGWLVSLYRMFFLEPDWILYGQLPAVRRENGGAADCVRKTAVAYVAPPSRVTVYAMSPADPQTNAWIREPVETIPLFDTLRRPNLLVVRMDNASMEPTIRRGAYVGIDGDDLRLRSGEIYALDIPGEGLVIKRVNRDLENQRLILGADNPLHPSANLPLENPGLLSIGKAIWVIQDI